MDQELVELAGLQVLLGDARAAGDADVLLARRGPGLLERGLDPIGDEGERRPALHREGLAGVVGEDEHRDAEGRVIAPPAMRVRVVLPGPGAAAVHPPPHDHRPVGVERLAD